MNLTTHRPEYDEQSLSIIADILGTLYSNPRRSVLREYIANGLDAHREAGVDKPLRVVLPTSQSQRLVIQDFGNGLSPRELHRVFFSYGRSTKWDAQDAIGMFGIGAKSAYSLSQTWEVRSVHEGMSYVAVAYNEDGPAFDITDGEKTDDPSGITVTIPLHGLSPESIKNFEFSAMNLLMWLPEGSVRFFTTGYNGEDVAVAVTADRQTRVGNVYVGMNYLTGSTAGAVMNNIHYTYLSSDFSSTVAAETRKLMEREIGHIEDSIIDALSVMPIHVANDGPGIHISPSREQVKETSLTTSTLASAVAETVNKILDRVEDIQNMDMSSRVYHIGNVIWRTNTDILTEEDVLLSYLIKKLIARDTLLCRLGLPSDRVVTPAGEGIRTTLYRVMSRVSRNTLLVTDAPDERKLPGIRKASKTHTVYVTKDDGTVTFDEGKLDLRPLFTTTETYKDFCARNTSVTKEVKPLMVWDTNTSKTRFLPLSGVVETAFDMRCNGTKKVTVLISDPRPTRSTRVGDDMFTTFVNGVKNAGDLSGNVLIISRGRRKVETIVEALRETMVTVHTPNHAKLFVDQKNLAKSNSLRSSLNANDLLRYAVRNSVNRSDYAFLCKLMENDSTGDFNGHWIRNLVKVYEPSEEKMSEISRTLNNGGLHRDFEVVVGFKLTSLLPLMSLGPSYHAKDEDHVKRYLLACSDLDPLPSLVARIDAWRKSG